MSQTEATRPRRRYEHLPAPVVEEALRVVLDSTRTIEQVAREAGVSPNTLTKAVRHRLARVGINTKDLRTSRVIRRVEIAEAERALGKTLRQVCEEHGWTYNTVAQAVSRYRRAKLAESADQASVPAP